MPADSGWYWCQTDSYQVVVYVQVGPLQPQPLPLVPAPMSMSASLIKAERKGTADQLQVYDTYQSKWQDEQVHSLLKFIDTILVI